MKKITVLILSIFFYSFCSAQSYEVLNFNINGTPNNGVNIKTKLPFTNISQMVTLHIEGYSYLPSEVISLNLVWYIYGNAFTNTSIASSGSYTPEVFLTNNGGFVNVYINDKIYFQRFKITAFAKGMSEQSAWFQDWTAADEVMQGTQAVNLVYKNKFKGTVTNNGDFYSSGNAGIGTTDTKGYKLAVNGKIRAQEIKVETDNWPDYVFKPDYQLPTLEQTEQHIKLKGHLPGIPSAEEVKKNGIDLGNMNAKLLKKIEELTLYLIEIERKNGEREKVLQQRINQQEKAIEQLSQKSY